MKTKIKYAIVAGFTLIIALAGQVQAFTALGRGNSSCGQFLQAVEDEHKARPRHANPEYTYTGDYLAFKTYAMGFLSGANWEKAEDGDASAGFSLDDNFVDGMTWLENYCRQRPLDHYVKALINLRNTLAAQGQ